MICQVTLISKTFNRGGTNECDEIKLDIEDTSNVKPIVRNECVYQNYEYSVNVQLSDKSVEVEDISFFVNRKKLSIHTDGSNNTRIFSTLFGYAQIHIEITTADEKIISFTSDYLVVAVKNNDTSEQSLKLMIDEIYQKNQSWLYQTTVFQRSLNFHKIDESSFRTLDTEYKCLEDIRKAYEKNISDFSYDLKHKMKKTNTVDDFNKVKSITPKVLSYICTHPEQFTKSNYSSGIKIGRKYYYPQKSLVEKNIQDSNIYENQVILGFLKYLIECISMKINHIYDICDDLSLNISNLRNGYKLSSIIINQLTQFRVNDYKIKLTALCDSFKTLYRQYACTLKCEPKYINQLPNPTRIFMTNHHYRNIYTVIYNWFKHGDYNLEQENLMMHFLTADQIYEYYCLLSLLELLQNKGYSFVTEQPPINFQYSSPCKKYYTATLINNTYVLKKDTTVITLYYQPVIYQGELKTDRNNISLYRVDKSYYTPDFVLKICDSSKKKYVILDSKWSKRSTIRNYELKDVMFKYGLKIRSYDDINSLNSVWILQGQDDDNSGDIYRVNSANVRNSKDSDYKNQYGILTLTPKTGIINLDKIISSFI